MRRFYHSFHWSDLLLLFTTNCLCATEKACTYERTSLFLLCNDPSSGYEKQLSVRIGIRKQVIVGEALRLVSHVQKCFTRSGLSLLFLLEELPVVKLPILETLNEVGRGRSA